MGARILIVDDNPINLRLATEVLKLEGHTVLNAVDAEQALEMLGHFVPDLVLMDLALPGMDGLTLTRKLKAEPRLKDVPVIALTAFAMKGDDQKALDAGCVAYITKPIDTRRLPQQVAEILAGDAP
jgi:two-component system cell cycle response regulator